MRLILEKSEIVAILGKHFEATFDPEDVIIRTDPEFEIELCGLPLGDAPPPKEENNVVQLPTRTAISSPPVVEDKELAKRRNEPGATTETPPPGNDGQVGDGVEIHPAAVLAQSKALEAELDRENPQLKRRSGSYSYEPPGDFKNEI